MATTFSSIPQELVELIMEQVYALEGQAIFRCALVHSTWTDCCLKLLYRELAIVSQEDAKRLARSAALALYKTELVAVGDTTGPVVYVIRWCDELLAVFRACSEMQKLRISSGVLDVPPTLFCDIAFPCLRNLSIGCQFIDTPHTSLPRPPFPLSLDFLVVNTRPSTGTTFALDSIVAAFLQIQSDRKTPFKLSVTTRATTNHLHPLASHITTFELFRHNHVDLSRFSDFMSSGSLSNFRLHWPTTAELRLVLGLVTPHLEELFISLTPSSRSNCVALLNTHLPRSKFINLKILTLGRMSQKELEAIKGGFKLIKNLAGEGIDVTTAYS